ncbi:MAG: thioesterase family protein [Chloroherpetonaceae bacterium]|nr:acyl-CoA thioesterase [Chthonomonadaceae bacterium]MDW8209380.1 thioesterase family protein [Chloroherpetonaceae bacterium]
MACDFKMIHRVDFAHTDMAGIAHFSNYFRYMENTEHAFFRSLGFSIHTRIDGRTYGWPRVHASCDFLQPIRFEEEIEVHLIVRQKRAKSLTYDFVFRRASDPAGTEVARGSLTVVCTEWDAQSGRMRAVDIPEIIARHIEEYPGQVPPASGADQNTQ